MTALYRADLTLWSPSDRIDEVLYPSSIAWLWTGIQLAEIGLYRPAAADPVPEGMQIISTAPQWIDGVMQYVNVVEPEASTPLEATRAQAESALYYFRLPDGTDPQYYEQYEAALQNHPYPPVRMWAKGSLKWVENHDYVRALGMELVPPIDEATNHQLFVAAQNYE